MHVDNITLYADNKMLAKGTAVYPGGDAVIPDPTPEPEDPVSPTTPEVYDFEGDYTTATRQLENGGSVEEIFFENGVTVAYGGKANVQGATAEVVTDGDNKYITITAPKRVHDRDRSHQINVELYGDATGAKAYVYEMDLKIDSVLSDGSASNTQYFNLMFYSGDLSDGRYIHYMMSETNGILSIISPDGSVAVAKVDEWFTLRIEFVIADGKAKAFVKNSSGEYDYRGDLPNTSWSAKAGSGNFSGLGSKVDTVIVSASHNNKAGFSMHIDNLSLTTTASTTSAGTVVPPKN